LRARTSRGARLCSSDDARRRNCVGEGDDRTRLLPRAIGCPGNCEPRGDQRPPTPSASRACPRACPETPTSRHRFVADSSQRGTMSGTALRRRFASSRALTVTTSRPSGCRRTRRISGVQARCPPCLLARDRQRTSDRPDDHG